MSMRLTDDGTGNSEKDWEIFDVLCKNMEKVCAWRISIIPNPPCSMTLIQKFLSSPIQLSAVVKISSKLAGSHINIARLFTSILIRQKANGTEHFPHRKCIENNFIYNFKSTFRSFSPLLRVAFPNAKQFFQRKFLHSTFAFRFD